VHSGEVGEEGVLSFGEDFTGLTFGVTAITVVEIGVLAVVTTVIVDSLGVQDEV
jgi:hypothetical protein